MKRNPFNLRHIQHKTNFYHTYTEWNTQKKFGKKMCPWFFFSLVWYMLAIISIGRFYRRFFYCPSYTHCHNWDFFWVRNAPFYISSPFTLKVINKSREKSLGEKSRKYSNWNQCKQQQQQRQTSNLNLTNSKIQSDCTGKRIIYRDFLPRKRLPRFIFLFHSLARMFAMTRLLARPCCQLIKVQPIIPIERNRNIFRCLFHQYFKLFAF